MKGKNLKTFDPYEILGISMDAEDKTIRKAFRKLARQFHPDKNPGDPTANKKFVLVNKAFSCLENEETRKNCLTKGNAEGTRASVEVGIAMPVFLLKKENKFAILSLFFILILVILPSITFYVY